MLRKFNKKNAKFCKSRFNRTRFDNDIINKFNFESGLISKKIEDLHFTNYAVDTNDEAYNYVLSYYINYLDNDYSFINTDFNMDEAEGLNINYRTLRLLDILSKVQNQKYSKKDCKYILKLNSTKCSELHFYFRKNKNNLKLILIDLYHLGIYGTRYIEHKERIIDIERLYRHHKNNNCDLADIKKLSDQKISN